MLFNAPVRYGQSRNAFCFDARWLDCAVRQDSASLHGFLRRSLGNLVVRYRDRSRITERVRCYLRQHLQDGSVPVEQVAEAFGMTPDTLRRRLRMEQARFQDLKDGLRRDAAIEYLACPNLALAEVAERLGFSEPSTFHRAFKKWTGLPPGSTANWCWRRTVRWRSARINDRWSANPALPVLPVSFPHLELEQFAGTGHRHLVNELDAAGAFVVGNVRLAVADQLRLAQLAVRAQFDGGVDPFPQRSSGTPNTAHSST